MELSEKNKQGIAEAANIMADAGRIDSHSIQDAVRQANSTLPTAQQAADNLIRNIRALREIGW